MEFNDLNQLEEKVKNLVVNLKLVRDENKSLQKELELLKTQYSSNNQERLEIKKKVETLIELIDSIEK